MKKEPIGYIYMFTNRINGKKYIGQHEYKNGIDENYFGSGKNNKNGGFYGAKEKYGLENFKFDILCFCNNKEELDNAESYYVGFKYYTYAKTGRGYNIADGGNGGNTLRGKTEKELREWKMKLSEAHIGEKNSMYGKNPYANKTEEEMREINKKKSETWNNKTEEELEKWKKKLSGVLSIPVIGVNLKTGEVLELESGKQGENFGFNNSCIANCCKGKYKTHKGYKFYYKSDYEKLSKEDIEKDLIESRITLDKCTIKQVVGINLKTNEIIELNSGKQGKELGFDNSAITNCCKGKRKSHKGYKFYYKSDYLALQETETIEMNLNLSLISNINISI